MLLIHFRRLTASQEKYLANLWVHLSSGWGQSFCCSLLEHGPTLSHQMSQVRKQYMVRPLIRTEDLVYRARTQTTELKSHTHRRHMTISICLIRFIPESTRNHAGADETVPLLPAAETWTHTEPQNVKGEETLPLIFTPAEDRTCDTLHAHPNLYRAAIKAGLYRRAVQVCYIPKTTTYSGIHRLLLLVHFKSVRFGFPVPVRSFRNGSPVYSLTIGDVKRRGLDRRSLDLIKRIASHL